MKDATPEQIVAFLTRGKMTDIAMSMAQERIKELRAEVERRDQIIKSRDDRCTRLEAEIEQLRRRITMLEGLLGNVNVMVPDDCEPKP